MHYAERRNRLLSQLERPLLLLAGGHTPRNYPANPYPYRADSNFLYYFASPEPDSVALFDPADKTVTLFVPPRSIEESIWHGPQSSLDEVQALHRVTTVQSIDEIDAHLSKRLVGRSLDSIAIADPHATRRASERINARLEFADPANFGRPEVLQLIAKQRLTKDADELDAMRFTATVTRTAHLGAITASRPGVPEQQLAGIVEGAFAVKGCTPAYQTILSVRGEVLHNHFHLNTLQQGDIVLLDGGAEGPLGYCSDVTRCWPVGGPFTREGAAVYDAVLASNEAAIAAVKPGARYRDIHLLSAQVIAEGLIELGILKGSASALVESGAHALFYPHGVGHQIGLDVHDVEAFGDQIHYPNGRTRSSQFGTRFLRMDMDLTEGMTFTIEPGIYFVPAIIRSPELRAQFKGQVDFDRAETFLSMNGGRGFGGIRIEDDVVCTASGVEVLTAAIPKRRDEIESLVS